MNWQMDKFHTATMGAKRIAVCDENENRLGIVPLGHMMPPDRTKRMYSFGLLSDLHLCVSNEANAAFQKAIEHLDADKDVELICVTGDITQNDADDAWVLFKSKFNYVDGKPVTKINGKPIFAVTGNHEELMSKGTEWTNVDKVKAATGIGVWGWTEHHGDVFVFLSLDTCVYNAPVGVNGAKIDAQLFFAEDWVNICGFIDGKRREGKRIFVVKHVPLTENHLVDHEPPTSRYYLPLSKYKDTTVFYGHLHKNLSMTTASHRWLCRDDLGFNGVFVPALSGEGVPAGHGYIVDVYPNGIHLRGYDFAGEQIQAIPTGTFWIDTDKFKQEEAE